LADLVWLADWTPGAGDQDSEKTALRGLFFDVTIRHLQNVVLAILFSGLKTGSLHGYRDDQSCGCTVGQEQHWDRA
jgi:hypothetical protein